MMKIGILSAGVLLMALTGCTGNESEEEVGDAPGASIDSGGSGPAAAGGSTGGTTVGTGSGGYETGGTAGTGGSPWDCQQAINDCYAEAYACCGQGVDEQCEMMAGSCASIICPDPYPYPLTCTDFIVPIAEGADEIQAFELAVSTCLNYGLTATSAELLELGVFVTCCPDPNSGGGMGTGGTGWAAGGSTGTGGASWGSGSGGYEEMSSGAGGYSTGGTVGYAGSGGYESGSGGFSTGGTGMGGTGVGGIGAGGTGPIFPGFCGGGMGGEGGIAGAGGLGGTGMGGAAGEGGEGGFATGGMPAD